MDSLEHTFPLLDGQLTTQIADIKNDISHFHSVHSTSLDDWLTYFALALTILNTIIICLLYCRITGSTLTTANSISHCVFKTKATFKAHSENALKCLRE